MRMPGMDGTRLLEMIAASHPRISRLMMTGDADQQTAAAAVNQGGVLGFLSKPCAPDALTAMLDRDLRQYELETQEQQLLERTLAGSIMILFEVLAAAQPRQFGRANRLRDLARQYGRSMGAQAWLTDMAAMLSDIGALVLPANRTSTESAALESAAAGATLIAHVPRLGPLADIIRYKPAHFDGTHSPRGYPVGELIPVEARVLAILDGLLELAGASSPAQTHLRELSREQGRYDPELLGRLGSLLPAEQMSQSETEIQIGFANSLMVGDRLLEDVLFKDGQLALAGGIVLSEALIATLRGVAELRPLKTPVRIARVERLVTGSAGSLQAQPAKLGAVAA
jgi:response regulator RpfG family c-di-GMP phosphodiesterase